MRSRLFSLFIFCFSLLLLNGCGSGEQNSRTIKFTHEVDSLINDTATVAYKVDSLKKEIRLAKDDTAAIRFLSELAFSWRTKNTVLPEEVMRLSKEINYEYGICVAKTNIGYAHQRAGKIIAADSMFRISLQQAKTKGFTDLQIQNLVFIGDLLRLQDKSDTALLVLNEALTLARNSNDQRAIAFTLNAMGEAYRNKSQNIEAIKSLEEALSIAHELHDKGRMAICLGGLSSIYRAQNNYPKALDYSQQSLAVALSINDKKSQASCYNVLGAIYFQQQDYERALKYFSEALRIGEELKDNVRITNAYLSLGAVYEQDSNFKAAIDYYEKGRIISEKTNNNEYLSYSLSAIGNIYRTMGNVREAQRLNAEALALARETDNIGYISNDLFNEARDFLSLGKIDSAIQAAKEGLSEGVRGNSPENTMKASELLYRLHDTLGDYENAYKMHLLYTKMKDSITNVEQVRKFASTEFKEKEEAYKTDKLKSDEALKREKLVRNGFIGGSIIFAILAVVILFSLVRNKRAKKIIEKQKSEVEKQKNLVEVKQKEILDSINYAKRLQAAILPPVSQIEKIFPESFVIYYPKDIVAGDFYWMESIGDFTFIAAADSTGHGVPGAMVSVVCSNALNQAVKEFGLTNTGLILDKVTDIVLETFARSEENVSDGMDISLLSINRKNKTAEWSGANNSLWYFENSAIEMIEVKADKQPVGQSDLRKPFLSHTISLDTQKTFYLFTDGFADQFGGPKGKKFKYKQLKSFIFSVAQQPLKEQSRLISTAFLQWKSWPDENGQPKSLEQVDDMTVLGIRI